MRAGETTALLAEVLNEMLDLRRDISDVLTNLFKDLKTAPDAKQLIGPSPTVTTVIIEDEAAAQVAKLREELLELRQDVAFVMANLYVEAGRSQEQAKRVVIDALNPKKKARARGTRGNAPEGRNQ